MKKKIMKMLKVEKNCSEKTPITSVQMSWILSNYVSEKMSGRRNLSQNTGFYIVLSISKFFKTEVTFTVFVPLWKEQKSKMTD